MSTNTKGKFIKTTDGTYISMRGFCRAGDVSLSMVGNGLPDPARSQHCNDLFGLRTHFSLYCI